MYILGLNAYHGDSAAALLKDGVVVAALEEERLRRVKHWAGFPSQAIAFCLERAGIGIADVDHVTVSRDPSAKLHSKIGHVLWSLENVKPILDRLANMGKVGSLKATLAAGLGVDASAIRAAIHNVEHHRSHCAAAFFASGFDEAAVLSVDGFGDFSSTMTAIGRGTALEAIDTVTYPHSLGIFYTAFTQWLGFAHYGDEYKVMGLAPYGRPLLADRVRSVVKPTADGLFRLEARYFSHAKRGVTMSWEGGAPEIGPLYSDRFVDLFGPVRAEGEEITDYHRNVAASVQRVYEEILFHMLDRLHARTGMKNVCLSGGCAQNSVANGKVRRSTPFTGVYIPSAGHDAGTSIGSALYLHHHVLGNPRAGMSRGAYFGPSFGDDEIQAYLESAGERYSRHTEEELIELVSDLLARGMVVGWFQGGAEFGPRALGNRSILVDPGRADAKELLNSKVKKREPFRPFAPSILRHAVNEYFEQEDDVLFMEKVFDIREEKRALLPAVTHVDGTGRLQTVHADVSPKYYRLIERFGERRGYPIILNTSFNENEPIVTTPQEAHACYLRTTMDALVMGNCLVRRRT